MQQQEEIIELNANAFVMGRQLLEVRSERSELLQRFVSRVLDSLDSEAAAWRAFGWT